MIPTEALNELNFQRRVRHLHRLGPRALAELLTDMAAISARRVWLDAELQRYSALDPSLVEAIGASEFPPQIFSVEGGQR